LHSFVFLPSAFLPGTPIRGLPGFFCVRASL
jgi:hypothetical protein